MDEARYRDRFGAYDYSAASIQLDAAGMRKGSGSRSAVLKLAARYAIAHDWNNQASLSASVSDVLRVLARFGGDNV